MDEQARAYALLPEDDDHHPLAVLGRWTLMIAEDYGHELPPRLDLAFCADYLDRHLHRIAQDPEQDFPLLARETRRCLNHLEAVLRDSRAPERGAPCPDCLADGRAVRLNREYGHWCFDEACERIHYLDDSGDRWVCPRNRAHSWSHRDYENWIEERQQARAGA